MFRFLSLKLIALIEWIVGSLILCVSLGLLFGTNETVANLLAHFGMYTGTINNSNPVIFMAGAVGIVISLLIIAFADIMFVLLAIEKNTEATRNYTVESLSALSDMRNYWKIVTTVFEKKQSE